MERKYHYFDASKKRLGRLAVEVAIELGGKRKVDYVPNIDGGDFAVVVNSDNLIVSGNKMEGKIYNHYSGYPGGIKSIKLKDQIEKDSRKAIEYAVYGMLPKNKLRKTMMKRLLIYKDDNHSHKIDVRHE